MSNTEFNQQVDNLTVRRWSTEYQADEEWKPNKRYWGILKSKQKIKVKRIIEILTGHGNFRNMLQKKQQSTLSVCRICKLQVESAKHLLYDCIGTSNERNKLNLTAENCEDRINLAEELLKRSDINEMLKGVDIQGISTAQ